MAINISHLNKHIGKQHVLKDICLSIGDGEVVGLLGPNGAGKSTLMKIMVGVWEGENGKGKGENENFVLQVPKSIGFLPEQNPLYEDMYVREYLRFFVGLRLQAMRRLGDKAKGWEYITPRSSAILPSITNDSLMTLAREMGMKVTRRRIRVEELADIQEAAACGTACVISPLTKVFDPDNNITYSFGDKPGPVLTKLYHALQDIQYGRTEDKHGWCTIIE